MKSQPWVLGCLVVFGIGCGTQSPPTREANAEHKSGSEKQEAKFAWGPVAPEPPIMPSMVPQLPEQTKSMMNPGDVNGPKAEDKLIPSTSSPAAPK